MGFSSYEQRKKFYDDVEKLISPGFLSHPVKFGGVTAHFRTLSPGEFYLLQARTNGLSNEEWRRHLIAHSLWMLDGELVSEVSPNKIFKILRNVHSLIIQDLSYVVSALMRRELQAQSSVGAFVLEEYSRQLWKTKSHEKFVIPGFPKLGWNRVQRMWIAYNESADATEESKKEWDRVKILIGVHNSKAVQAWDEKDRNNDEKYEESKQEYLDNFLLRNLGLDVEGGESGSASAAPILKSHDDLEEEFRKWREGEMDEHDKIVEAYKQKILAAQKEQEESRQKRWESLQSNVESQTTDVPLVAYTPQQLNEILKNRPKGRIIYSDNIQRNEVLDRHLSDPSREELAVTSEGQIVTKSAFMSQLNSRQVKLSSIEGS